MPQTQQTATTYSLKMQYNLYIFCQFIVLTYSLASAQRSVRSIAQVNNKLQHQGNNYAGFFAPSLNLSAPAAHIGDNLFKLNTDVLFDRDEEANIVLDASPSDRKETEQPKAGFREARKMNFLRGLWNKPKVSPLYLVNGTVCRFVNTTPICTTLTTTGLLPTGAQISSPSTSGQSEGPNPVVQFPFNNQQQQQFSNGNNNGQQFLNNNNAPRPSAVLDDDSQDINVEVGTNLNTTEGISTMASNSTITYMTQQIQTTARPPATTLPIVQAQSRPINLATNNRRPINLLSLRRPMRQYHH